MNNFKKTALFLLAFWLALPAPAMDFKDNPWFTSKDLMIKDKTHFELFGGVVNPNMIYSNKSFNNLEQVPLYLWDAGFSFRFQRGKWFSFSPRLTYFCQGISINDVSKYSFRENLVSFTLPFELQFDLNKKLNKCACKFFIYTGPYIASTVSVHIKTQNYSDWLSYNEMNKINWGGEVGLGFRIPTFSLQGSSNINIRFSYLRGVNDTYTKFEKNLVDQSLRDQLYITDGKRFNSAVKLTIGIEIPLKARKFESFTAGGDGKHNYKRVVVVDEK